jgi:capsular polysaccharide transport system permease protein
VIASGVDLDAIFAGDDSDFLAHLGRSASVEKRQRYWRRMVDPFFDLSTGIVSVEVRAFRPVDAQLVARTVLRLSEKLMNDISSRSHDDMVAYAVQVVDDVESKLKAAQTATSDYRNLHAVLFPEMQATADSTVEGTVEQSLIQAKATYNAQLAQGAAKDAVQMTMLRQHIVAIETELQGLHGRLAKTRPGGVPDPSLASVLSGYNMLLLNEQIVAKVYERALIELLDARSAASQQSVYLAAFVRPGLPQDSMYPVRWRVMLETALLSFVGWCLLQLLYHGVRDHID